MKLLGAVVGVSVVSSRPARGAWVEMVLFCLILGLGTSRAPQGARGLKSPQLSRNYGPGHVAPRKGRVG